MKELSIEEKAKRYDEAIEIAKEINNERQAQPFNVMTKVFPELAESEDEKIRQLLLRFVKYDMSDNYSDDFTPADCVAWLEKQGKNNMGISEATKQELEDSLNKALEKETPESRDKFLDWQGVQKSAWRKDDDAMFNFIALILRNHQSDEDFTTFETTFKDCIDWFKNLKDRVQPQPKQEWSEEDKKLINDTCHLINTLASGYGEKVTEPITLSGTQMIASIKDRLSALVDNRHQSAWKPSDEQMAALKESVDEHFDIDGGALWHLYEDLKKLK